MSQTKTHKTNDGSKINSTVEVLYQKMGDRWFAFSVMGEEVFVGSISQEEIDTLEKSGRLQQDGLVKRRIGSA